MSLFSGRKIPIDNHSSTSCRAFWMFRSTLVCNGFRTSCSSSRLMEFGWRTPVCGKLSAATLMEIFFINKRCNVNYTSDEIARAASVSEGGSPADGVAHRFFVDCTRRTVLHVVSILIVLLSFLRSWSSFLMLIQSCWNSCFFISG
jgi:hypothetical protein